MLEKQNNLYPSMSEKNLKPVRFAKILKFLQLGLLSGGVFLAGGSLRTLIDLDETISDYDLFFESQDALNSTKAKLTNLNFELIFECPEGKLFTFRRGNMKIQCVSENFYLTAKELISTFDFTCCAAAFDGNCLWVHRSFPIDVRKKRLTLLNLSFPVATFGRIIKYSKKGYNYHSIRKQFCLSFEGLVSSGFRLDENTGRVYID